MIEIPKNIPKNSKFLKGTGASAWFYIESGSEKELFKISRFNIKGILECKNIFLLEKEGFNIHENFEITFVSHCLKCTVLQNNIIYIFTKVK